MFDALTARPAPRRWRTPVLVGSLALHAAAIVGVMAWAMWTVEPLLPDRSPVEIGVVRPLTPPPEAPAAAAAPPKARPRKPPPPVPVQPTPPQLEQEPVAPTAGTGAPDLTGTAPVGNGEGTGTGTEPGACAEPPCGEGPVVAAVPVVACGDGARAGAEQCDDGNARNGDGCSSTCRLEVRQILPKVIESLRVSGEARILPPSTVQSQMARDGSTRAVGVFRVCLDAAGSVARVSQLTSTGFDEYDRRLAAGIRDWRYRPYQVDGHAVPACGTVQFVYQQR